MLLIFDAAEQLPQDVSVKVSFLTLFAVHGSAVQLWINLCYDEREGAATPPRYLEGLL